MCRWDIWTRKGKSGGRCSPPNLGILCHGFERLGFGGKECSSIHMNKVLKEQSGLGGSTWKRRHLPGSHPDGPGGGREEIGLLP